MIVCAHQPVYLPWLGFLHKIQVCDTFVLMDDVKFSRNSVYARNKIRSTNGTARWLTVPVTRESHDLPINRVLIASGECWQKKHLNAIKAAYHHAPFYKKYIDFFEWVYRGNRWVSLLSLNLTVISQLLDWYGIRTRVVFASDYGFVGSKCELILNYCIHFGADRYLFGRMGLRYADRELFEKKGVTLAFQDYVHPVYGQGSSSFLPNLAAIDLLFHHGIEARQIFMSNNVDKGHMASGALLDGVSGAAAGSALLPA